MRSVEASACALSASRRAAALVAVRLMTAISWDATSSLFRVQRAGAERKRGEEDQNIRCMKVSVFAFPAGPPRRARSARQMRARCSCGHQRSRCKRPSAEVWVQRLHAPLRTVAVGVPPQECLLQLLSRRELREDDVSHVGDLGTRCGERLGASGILNSPVDCSLHVRLGRDVLPDSVTGIFR